MSAEGPFLGGSRQEYFQLRPGEHHGPHIPPVRDQAGWYRKGPLPRQQGLTDPLPGSHPGGPLPRLLRANPGGYIPPLERYALIAVRGNRERHVHACGEGRVPLLVLWLETCRRPGERYQTIESAAIKKAPAHFPPNRATERALPRAARASA